MTRLKTCQYRHCSKAFTDTGPFNTGKYCSPECGRREKMFRSGKAKDESYFRVRGGTGLRTCVECRGTYTMTDKGNRCPDCRDKARNKTCKACQAPYRDGSENNTRRFCDACQSSRLKP